MEALLLMIGIACQTYLEEFMKPEQVYIHDYYAFSLN